MSTEEIRIRMKINVRPDFPLFYGALGVKPGTVLKVGMEYEATTNKNGAISGICENGEALGVKPGEFEFVQAPEWVLQKHNGTDRMDTQITIEKALRYYTDGLIQNRPIQILELEKQVPIEDRKEFCDLAGMIDLLRSARTGFVQFKTDEAKAKKLFEKLDKYRIELYGEHGEKLERRK